jgi:DhnA family fructose-bisphosphate aldolase class Ia
MKRLDENAVFQNWANAEFPPQLVDNITEIRVRSPRIILDEALRRKRRPLAGADGKLLILAADHPGRGVISAPGDTAGMADRRMLLARIWRVLQEPCVDGVMATADILEELLLIDRIQEAAERRRLLDGRLLIACMNRGGLAGAAFEMRDRFTGYAAREIERMGLDGAKMMFRLDPDSPDSAATIFECAEAVRELNEREIPTFLEPLPVERRGGSYRVVKEAEALARVVSIATALTGSTRNLWLKLPFVPDFGRAAAATTCPILMLGGESRGDPEALLSEFAEGLAAGRNVRGALVGRNVLFPGSEDPAAVARSIGELIHGSGNLAQALNALRTLQPEPG